MIDDIIESSEEQFDNDEISCSECAFMIGEEDGQKYEEREKDEVD